MSAPASDPRFESARRRFLQGAAALAAVTLAPGVTLLAPRAAGAAASDKVRWAMLIDTTKCDAGCDHCVTACRDENGWTGHDRARTDPHWIRKVDLRDRATGATHSLPVMCQHCETPPCVDVCPTGASFKRADGIVLVDKHICIGCRYCMMACPYKARSFVHEDVTGQKPHAPRGKGTVESCTFCVHRVDAGQQPACVVACAEKAGQGAMVFGDLNDPNSEIAKAAGRHVTNRIRADLGLNQGVLYHGL
ncbi:MAG: 4Fe-4S dicluster domain-containing protein [Hyphomicrobiales bacterium]|nr:4Fe-4S dicluster domain-containing protein [Hyphomicrobiales bacterium]MCP5374347.1 4Fe-4S dicluster domain-containing protein [Hyphomicrobiales bacterium]